MLHFTINFCTQVTRLQWILFHLRPGVSLRLYAHEKGEEFWFHYFYSNGYLFPSVSIDEDMAMMDVQVGEDLVYAQLQQLKRGVSFSRSPRRKPLALKTAMKDKTVGIT